MKAGDWIGGYVLERPLGHGEAGSTWLAKPEQAGGDVVLKILDIGEARNWTGFELFGREVDALKTLSHPGIPRFIESFEDKAEGDSRLVLAMELMPGVDLETATEKRRFTEAEVCAILAGLADILAYLGSLRPPVIHRDVNPRNVLLGPDGGVSLVDFSGAQETLRRAANTGATLIGTAGYIPLEQVSGRATIRSDLYGAAATALFLLTRRNPTEIPVKNLKPDLSSLPPLGPVLAAVLDSWLEPDESRRTITAEVAARIFRGEVEPPQSPQATANMGEEELVIRLDDEGATASMPSDSKVKIVEGEGRLVITIPPGGITNPAVIGIGGFSIVWLAFVAFWTFSAVAMGAPIFFALFSLPFWAVGIFMVRTTLVTIFRRTQLALDSSTGITLTERILGKGRIRVWPISDLGKCSVENAVMQSKGRTDREIVMEAGAKRIRFGKSLSEREQQAISGKIESWRRGRV